MPWNEGRPATGAQSLKIKLKLDSKEEEFTEFCVTTFDESLNLVTEDVKNFCNRGETSTYVLGYDREYTVEAVILAGKTAADIANKRNDIESLQGIEMQVTDELLDAQWTATVAITSLEIPGNGDETRKLSMTFKIFEGVIDYVTPIPSETP